MAARFIINFPISTEQFENDYCLSLCFECSNAQYNRIISEIQSDWRSFSNVNIQTSGSSTSVSCTGTLTGDITAKDDTRESVTDPICASKLTFNMLCAEFPAWLLELCNYYTSVKVILYAKQGSYKYVKWRGFLWDNALNMTVVDDLLSCQLVALDEVSISKYIRISDTWTASSRKRRTLPLLQYFKDYWLLMQSNFDKYYIEIGLTTSGLLQVNRSIALALSDSTYENDFLSNAHLPNSMYFDNEAATWQDALSDIAEIIGCTWLVGGYGHVNQDGYLLTSYDELNVGESWDRYVYDLQNGTVTHHNGSYRELAEHNPQKIGGDLQVSVEPSKYKDVKVKSEEKRFSSHEYLKDENIFQIEGTTQETKRGIIRRWGDYEAGDTFKDLKYHIFQYCEFDEKEDDFITFENCDNSISARDLVDIGYLPSDTMDFSSLNRPNDQAADGMQFVQGKIGAFPCRIGETEFNLVFTKPILTNYIFIANNNYGNFFNHPTGYFFHKDVADQQLGIKLLELRPRGYDNLIHPANSHYLKIDFSCLFLNETMGDNVVIPGTSLVTVLRGRDEVAFPSESTYYDFADEEKSYNGVLKEYGLHVVYSPYPFIKARISIGDFWCEHVHQDVSWRYIHSSSVVPNNNIPLIPVSDVVKKYTQPQGGVIPEIHNYYYTECRPKYDESGAVDVNVLIPPLVYDDSQTIIYTPIEGVLKIELFGQIEFFKGYEFSKDFTLNNSVVAAMIKDIDISYTDYAEIMGEDPERAETVIWDNGSVTKETLEVETNLCTPSHDGFFINAMVYNDGQVWRNVDGVLYQGATTAASMEHFVAINRANIARLKPTFIEFSMFTQPGYGTHNIEKRFQDFREVDGTFVPLERTFIFNRDLIRYKLQLLQEYVPT